MRRLWVDKNTIFCGCIRSLEHDTLQNTREHDDVVHQLYTMKVGCDEKSSSSDLPVVFNDYNVWIIWRFPPLFLTDFDVSSYLWLRNFWWYVPRSINPNIVVYLGILLSFFCGFQLNKLSLQELRWRTYLTGLCILLPPPRSRRIIWISLIICQDSLLSK